MHLTRRTLLMLAMVLFGYSDAHSAAAWKEMCHATVLSLAGLNDYLRIALSMLCCDRGMLAACRTALVEVQQSLYHPPTAVLNRTFTDLFQVAVLDQLGFACRFFDDSELLQFVDGWKCSAIANGDVIRGMPGL